MYVKWGLMKTFCSHFGLDKVKIHVVLGQYMLHNPSVIFIYDLHLKCVSCKGYNIGFALPIFQNDTCVSCAGYSDELPHACLGAVQV